MNIIEKDITLQEAIQKYELPFMLRRPSYTPNFVFRAERVIGEIVKGTAFRDGVEYTEKSYEYRLSQTVSVFEGAIRKGQTGNTSDVPAGSSEPTSPPSPEPVASQKTAGQPALVPRLNLLGFSDGLLFKDFFSKQIMDASFTEVLQYGARNTISIRILVINYLCLIQRKFRALFKDETPSEKADSFRLYFPAYTDAGASCFQNLDNLINRILGFSFDTDPHDYRWYPLDADPEVYDLLSAYRCEIKNSGSSFIPTLRSDRGELTVFGVFAIINSLLHDEERNALSFDLLGEVSNRSKYFLENLFKKCPSSEYYNNEKTALELKKERMLLSLYLHRTLVKLYFSCDPDGISDELKGHIYRCIFVGDTPDYTVGQLAMLIYCDVRNQTIAVDAIDEIFAIVVNRKYYNYLKWRLLDFPSDFLSNQEKFCLKLVYIAENLITEEDERAFSELPGEKLFLGINREQREELKGILQGKKATWEKQVQIDLYNVSDDISDVLFDDKLLGIKRWFFLQSQTGELLVEPVTGKEFYSWESHVINDSPLALITVKKDACVDVALPTSLKEEESSDELAEVELEEEEEADFDEDLSESFYNDLELTERTEFPLRDVLYTHRFSESVLEADEDIRRKINLIKKKFAYLSDSELRNYLNSQNSKHLRGRKGQDIPFYKFRVTRSARLFFCYGKDVATPERAFLPGTVILNELVIDHDDQSKAGAASVGDAFRFKDFVPKAQESVAVKAKTLLYNAETSLPILSDDQGDCVRLSLPAAIMGSAGSGKTCIAVEIYRNMARQHPGARILYVAHNQPLVNHVADCLRNSGIVSPNCLIFGVFCDPDYHTLKHIGRNTFSDYVSSLYETKYSKVNPDVFDMCFNSSIKGSDSLVSSMDPASVLLPKEVFLQTTAKKENIDIKEAELIYELARKYNDYLQEKHIWDLNDLALRFIRNAGKNTSAKYDLIIVDEVQDMTNLQIQALLYACKDKKKICLLGDRNQVVRPSTFNFGELTQGVYQSFNGQDFSTKILKKTYRCGERLINYLNSLILLRRKTIGAASQEDDEFEESMRGDADESMRAVLVTEGKVIELFIQRAKELAECTIIVDGEESKKRFLSIQPDTANIVTVEEAKGLEYGCVVLYNFVADNEAYFREIFDGSGASKKSTLHRIIFNKYYVSCTRAVDRIIICEEEKTAAPYLDTLFDGLDIKNDIDELNAYIDPSPDTWLREAIRLYESGAYDQSEKYLDKYAALISDPGKDYAKYKELTDCQKLLAESIDRETWQMCGATFEEYEQYTDALNVYENYLHDDYRSFLVNLKLGNTEHYIRDQDALKEAVRAADITEEDSRVILGRLLPQKQLLSINNRLTGIWEDMINGE